MPSKTPSEDISQLKDELMKNSDSGQLERLKQISSLLSSIHEVQRSVIDISKDKPSISTKFDDSQPLDVKKESKAKHEPKPKPKDEDNVANTPSVTASDRLSRWNTPANSSTGGSLQNFKNLKQSPKLDLEEGQRVTHEGRKLR